MVRDRVLLFSVGLILLFAVGLINPANAGDQLTVSLTASPSNVTVAAGGSGSTTITFHIIPNGGFSHIQNAIIACSGLPTGASCSTNPTPLAPILIGDGYQFTLTVSASPSTAPGTYSVMVQLTAFTDEVMIQPGVLAMSPIQFNPAGGGAIGPSSIAIQQTPPSVTITINVTPAIPEYPLGLPVLAIFMLVAYGLIKRRTETPKNLSNQFFSRRSNFSARTSSAAFLL